MVFSERVLCQFSQSVAVNAFYSCYRKEKCCIEGCCTSPYQMRQIWFYWGMFIVICVAISASTWLCRRTKRNRRRSLEAAVFESSPSCVRPPLENRGSGDLPSYNSAAAPSAPPLYEASTVVNSSGSGDLPRYNAAVAPSAPPPYAVVYRRNDIYASTSM